MRRWFIVFGLVCAVAVCIGSLRLPAMGGKPEPSNPFLRGMHGDLWSAKSNPKFVWFQSDGEYSVLTEPLYYKIDLTSEEFSVPAGFVTDYASVPQPLQWVVPKIGPHSVPAVVHDYLYWDQTCTREEADKILYATMEEYGAYLHTRLLVYFAVRAGAGWAWADSAAEKASGLPRFVPAPQASIPTEANAKSDCSQTQASWIPENVRWAVYRKHLAQQQTSAPTIAPLDPVICKLPEMTLFKRYWRTLF